LALLLPILKMGVDHALPRLRQPAAPGELWLADQPRTIDFSGEFTYLGYSGPPTARADEPLLITQYWAAQREIGAPYSFALYVTDDQGRVWQQPVARPFGYAHYPGDQGWQVGSYVRDAYEINLLPGTPPGLYWLEVEGFRRDAAVSLLPRNWPTGSNPARARVGQVQITSGDWTLTADNAAVDNFAPTPIVGRPGLTLLGWSVPDVAWRPGDVAGLDLLWQNEGDEGARPLPITLVLSDETGTAVAQQEATPGGAGIVRDKVQWRLPAELTTGRYTVSLTVGEQTIPLGEWPVDAPPHRFAAPDVAQTAVFTVPFASLVGYNGWDTAVGPGDTLELELVWQVLATADTSYRVFIHLLDEAGNLVAQSDAVPDHWTRPTTGWLPGEYIRDRHTLTLPPDAASGSYALRLGWYDPATGERVGEVVIEP